MSKIQDVNANEALICLEKIKNTFGCDIAYYGLLIEYETVKQALLELKAIKDAVPTYSLKYDMKANYENVRLFNKWHFRNSDEIYTCVLCGCKTCLSDSTSLMGYKLICNTCAYAKFPVHYGDARKWQYHEYEALKEVTQNERTNNI